MRVTATEVGGLAGDAFANVAPLFRTRVPVKVIRRLLDHLIDMRVEVRAKHPLVVATGNRMPEVTDHGVDVKQLAIRIPVVPPGIRSAMADDLKDLPCGMVAPDGAVQLRPLLQRRSRRTHGGRVGDPVPTIQPTVRPPAQTVHDVVPDGLRVEPIQQHLGVTIRHVVTILVSDETQRPLIQNPHATVADFHTRQVTPLLPKHGPDVVATIAVLVLKNQDAIPKIRVPSVRIFRIGVALRHPEAAL